VSACVASSSLGLSGVIEVNEILVRNPSISGFNIGVMLFIRWSEVE